VYITRECMLYIDLHAMHVIQTLQSNTHSTPLWPYGACNRLICKRYRLRPRPHTLAYARMEWIAPELWTLLASRCNYHLTFCSPVLYLERVKIHTSNCVHMLIMKS